MQIPILFFSLLAATLLYALSGLLGAGAVVAMPLTVLIPLLLPYWSIYQRTSNWRVAMSSLLRDPGDTLVVMFSLVFTLSAFLMVFMPQGSTMIEMQRPDLYRVLVDKLAKGTYAVVLFMLSYSIAKKIWLKAPEDARGVYDSERKRLHGRDSIDHKKVAIFFLVLALITAACRAYAYSKGRVSFESDVELDFGRFSSLFNIMSSLGVMSTGVFILLAVRQRSPLVYVLAIGAIVMEIGYGVMLGTKSNVIYSLLLCGYAYCIGTNRIPPFATIVGIFFAGIVFTAVAHSSRTLFREGGQGGVTMIAKSISNLFASRSQIEVRSDLTNEAYYSTRFNVMIPVLGSVAYVDSVGPAMDYHSYANAAFSLVPSFVFPGKPLPFFQNEYGRNIGLLGDGDGTTSIRPTIVGHAYYSFGLAGCLGVGLFCGAMVGMIMWWARKQDYLIEGLIIYTVFFSTFDVENSFSNAYGGLVKNLFLTAAAIFIAKSNQGKTMLRRGRG